MIVSVVPEAFVSVRTVALTPGSYRQTLPADFLRLLDVPRNMGAGGTAPGRVIRLIPRLQLDASDPLWMTRTGDEVEHFLYDFKVPRTFLVYPAPASALSVELVGSVSPPEVLSEDETIPLYDDYLTLLLDYTVFRAFSKDVDSATSSMRAKEYYAMFKAGLDALVQSTAARVPASQTGGSTA